MFPILGNKKFPCGNNLLFPYFGNKKYTPALLLLNSLFPSTGNTEIIFTFFAVDIYKNTLSWTRSVRKPKVYGKHVLLRISKRRKYTVKAVTTNWCSHTKNAITRVFGIGVIAYFCPVGLIFCLQPCDVTQALCWGLIGLA